MDNEIKKEMEVVEELVDEPMGDDDIKTYLPNAKIILYNDLKKYNNIDEILPHKKSFAIILYLNSPRSGHWCSIMKPNDKQIEFFDSYGKCVDHPLTWLTKEQNEKLGIHSNYLGDLLKKSGKEIIYNNMCFQGKDSDISTCGRHCCFRIKCMRDKDMNIFQYQKMMKNVKNKMNMSFDELVSTMVNDS